MNFRKVKKSIQEDFDDLKKYDVKNIFESKKSSKSIVDVVAYSPWVITTVAIRIGNELGGPLYTEERGYSNFVKGLKFKKEYSNFKSLFNDVQNQLSAGFVYMDINDYEVELLTDNDSYPESPKDFYKIFGGYKNALKWFMSFDYDEEDLLEYSEDIKSKNPDTYFILSARPVIKDNGQYIEWVKVASRIKNINELL